MDGGDDESRAELYRSMLDRFQSLEDSQQKLRQQFEVVLQEETRINLSSEAEKRPASDSGDVTSFPDWGFLPGAYFSGSPYRNVLEYMGHGVHVCSRTRSWEFTYWNRAAQKLYGYKDHEVVGQRDIKLLFNEEHHHSALAIMKRLTNGESWSGQLPLKKRSGQTFMAMVTMSPLYENGELVGIVTVSSDGAVFNDTQLGNMRTHQEQEHSKVSRIDFKKSSQWHHQRPQIVALPQLPSSISNSASKILLRSRSKRESEEAEVESRDVKADRPPKAPMAKFITKLQIGAVSNLEKVMDESFQQKSSEDNSTKEAAYEACLQRDSMANTSHISNLNANNHIKDAPTVTSDAVQRKQHATRSTTDDNSTGGAFLSAYERCSVKSVDEEDASPRISGSRRTPSSVVESEIRWEDLQFKEEIGQGSFAVVYRGIWNGSDVAVKVYYGNEYNEQVLLDYRKEIDIMRRLRHPNVLLFMGAVCTEEKLAIVTEYMPRGSLFKTIHRNNQALDIRRRLRMAIDVARGMNYLHHRNPPILHRDLKSSNLLVDKSWTVKVGDFGLSKLKCATFLTTRSGRGTPQWMAPEVLRNEPSTEKSDVFSFGVILWELMTERVPWSELNSLQVVGVVGFMDRRLDLPEDIDPQVSSIISDCWQSKPDDRPSFEDIILKMTELVQPGSGLIARSASVP